MTPTGNCRPEPCPKAHWKFTSRDIAESSSSRRESVLQGLHGRIPSRPPDSKGLRWLSQVQLVVQALQLSRSRLRNLTRSSLPIPEEAANLRGKPPRGPHRSGLGFKKQLANPSKVGIGKLHGFPQVIGKGSIGLVNLIEGCFERLRPCGHDGFNRE